MKKVIFAATLSLFAVACNTKIDEPIQYGQLSVALADEPAVEVVTKADALNKTSDDAKKYTVTIFDASGVQKYQATYFDFATQTLPLGTYYVTAENFTEAAAEEGNGKMRLFGRSSDVTLSAETLTQTATVNCTVANAKVTVKFDSSVEGRFENLQVTLAGGTTTGRVLKITQTQGTTETWFNPSNLVYTITGKFKSAGVEKDVTITNSASPIVLAAKSNIELVVKVNLENGQITSPTITVDTQIGSLQTENVEYNPYL